jgi:hypothetical protein
MSKKKKNQDKALEIKAQIEQVAEDMDIHPSLVTKKDLDVTDWTWKQVGGLELIKRKFFPFEEKDLAFIEEAKDDSAYISKLESSLGKRDLLDRKLVEEIQKNFKPIVKIKPTSLRTKNKSKIKREMVAMLNDTHIGVIVDPEEVNHGNSFDFKEAGRRFALFAKEVSDYKPHARNETKKLHLVLNGDLIAGLIHGLTTRSIHLMIHQINGAVHIFSHTIAHLAKDFEELEIHAIPGNHCRAVHKEHGKRAIAETYDSYANIIFYALSGIFKNNKQIKFNVPKTPYGFINLPAGRAMYAHGDHLFSKALGNPGRSINVKALSGAIKDFNAGEIAKGNKPVKLLLLAHVHTFAHFITDDGVEVYIAPSLSGLDQFAHSLTINNNFVAQVVFESTNKYILGDSRLIRLNEADNQSDLDKIIPEYKKELVYK